MVEPNLIIIQEEMEVQVVVEEEVEIVEKEQVVQEIVHQQVRRKVILVVIDLIFQDLLLIMEQEVEAVQVQ